MIGLHHRSDVDALTAGMRTGALDDVLFPENPVADAPRIINRYRTLFPIEDDNFLVGPMLELSFSAAADRLRPARPDLRRPQRARRRQAGRADQGRSCSASCSCSCRRRTSASPAILKLLVDVVGFYDADTKFLLIRARLRDSFVGIEGFAKLDLAGELLLAMQFGADPSFVLSAGGFHPRVQGPARRGCRATSSGSRVSFGIGPVKLSVEHYFAVTPNSVQAGWKASLKADFGVAAIEASLGWDALLYLSPRFYFLVDLEFQAKVKAFGETLASVGVTATLEGPGQWRVHGRVQLLDPLVGQDGLLRRELGRGARPPTPGTASLQQALIAELTNPDNLAPEGPVGGARWSRSRPRRRRREARAPARPARRAPAGGAVRPRDRPHRHQAARGRAAERRRSSRSRSTTGRCRRSSRPPSPSRAASSWS